MPARTEARSVKQRKFFFVFLVGWFRPSWTLFWRSTSSTLSLHPTPHHNQLNSRSVFSLLSPSPSLFLSFNFFLYLFYVCFFFMYINARETGHRRIGPSVFSRFFSCPIVLWLKIWAWDLRVLVSWIFNCCFCCGLELESPSSPPCAVIFFGEWILFFFWSDLEC